MTATRLLAVEDLSVTLAGPAGRRPGGREARLLDGVSFGIDRGGTLALVGESGSGKTMTARALLGLLPPAARARGRILWEGTDLLGLPESRRGAWRGRRMTLVSQEPSASLNPVLSVGEQVAELLRHHHGLSRREAAERAIALLEEVRLPDARARARDYPHRLSGGMRQRVEIAAALACAPDLLIADEPTTALDVTLQAQILRLIEELKSTVGTAVMLISHDIGVIGSLASRVAVFYAGRVVESGPADSVLLKPEHPYTQALLAALPRVGQTSLEAIGGQPPDLAHLPPGCSFAPRCPFRFEKCEQDPPLLPAEPGHSTACWRVESKLAVGGK